MKLYFNKQTLTTSQIILKNIIKFIYLYDIHNQQYISYTNLIVILKNNFKQYILSNEYIKQIINQSIELAHGHEKKVYLINNNVSILNYNYNNVVLKLRPLYKTINYYKYIYPELNLYDNLIDYNVLKTNMRVTKRWLLHVLLFEYLCNKSFIKLYQTCFLGFYIEHNNIYCVTAQPFVPIHNKIQYLYYLSSIRNLLNVLKRFAKKYKLQHNIDFIDKTNIDSYDTIRFKIYDNIYIGDININNIHLNSNNNIDFIYDADIRIINNITSELIDNL